MYMGIQPKHAGVNDHGLHRLQIFPGTSVLHLAEALARLRSSDGQVQRENPQGEHVEGVNWLLKVQRWANAISRIPDLPREPVVSPALLFGLAALAESLDGIVCVGLLPIFVRDHDAEVQDL